MGAPDDDAVLHITPEQMREALAAGDNADRVARGMWRHAATCGIWTCCGLLWDRSPRWYLDHGEHVTRELVWVRRGGPGERTEAGQRLVEIVARLDQAVREEFKKRSGQNG